MREMPPQDFAEMLRTAIKRGRVAAATSTAPCSASAPAWSTWRSSDERGRDSAARRRRLLAAPRLALARLALGAWLRTRTAGRLRRRRAAGARSVGVELPSAAAASAPTGQRADVDARRRPRQREATARSTLRERGAELLRRSADVHDDEDGHPAYERILDELAARRGAHPAAALHEGPAGRRSTCGRGAAAQRDHRARRAGADDDRRRGRLPRPERVPAYLNNLYRLGLIWFSREPLDGPAAPTRCSRPSPTSRGPAQGRARGRTVRRSIR